MLCHNVHTILSNHILRIVLPTYILNVLHIVRSLPIANGSVIKASKLDGDDEHGTSRVVQKKEAYRSNINDDNQH